MPRDGVVRTLLYTSIYFGHMQGSHQRRLISNGETEIETAAPPESGRIQFGPKINKNFFLLILFFSIYLDAIIFLDSELLEQIYKRSNSFGFSNF